MANDVAQLYFDDAAAAPAQAPALDEAERGTSAWPEAAENLALVLDGTQFEAMLAEAASWADRITVCVTAPQSQHGSLPWWGELLARSSKCDRIYLRRAEQAEGWLLHQLYDTGALRLLDAGGRQVASNLLMFVRTGELRVLLSHIPLERAAAGAAFGTLLAFRGSSSADFARSCRAQLASWTERARIPSGSEIDALAFAARRTPSLTAFEAPGAPRVVADPVQIEVGLRRLLGSGVDLRAFSGGYRVHLRRSPAASPFVLTLHAGAGWAAGNGLLLEARDGRLLLVWRGGLLGHSRSRSDLLWSEARLYTFALDDVALGSAQRVALVAHGGSAAGPQVEAFLRELVRLGEAFNVEPPPALGHALADFTTLGPRQQSPLLWRALLGLGALDIEQAVSITAEVLRDQGYVSSRGLEAGGPLRSAIEERLAEVAPGDRCFDRPEPGKIRAVQPDVGAYLLDDWRQCLLQALPEDEVVAQRTARELAFARARDVWGLDEPRLVRDGAVDRLLGAALASALSRGFLVRIGAGGVKRLSAFAPAPEVAVAADAAIASGDGLLTGWRHELSQLPPVQRMILLRRSGSDGVRESLDSLARRLGLGEDRARQLEVQAWRLLESNSSLIATFRSRLTRALAGARLLPVRLLIGDDAWWLGIDQELGLAASVFENALGGELHVVELGLSGRREAFFARFDQSELERAFSGLLERAAQLETPATLQDYAALAASVAQPLDAALSPYLREALEAQLELDLEVPSRVRRFVPSVVATFEELPPDPYAAGSESRLRLEDAILAAFRVARAPLSHSAVAARVRLRVDATDDALTALLVSAPFAQMNAGEYGLLARDVPGGHEAIATALCAVFDALGESQRALGEAPALALIQQRVEQSWSPELVRSLLGDDPALSVTPSGEIALRRWQIAGASLPSEPVCPGIPATLRGPFEALTRAPLGKPDELVRRLRSELGRLERAIDAEDFVSASLARQLCDLYERLVMHCSGTRGAGAPPAAKPPAPAERLAQAAVQYFFEAIACDEDAPDAGHVERERLLGARTVLKAVLDRLELDWL